ncbi:unnamed protein product [Rotaria sordida]|uniref:PGAP2IP C-terminal nuclease-like domain-containing protein n=1 Tax=Rotaria sordida TaxID=392033 RepID=A0A815CXX2_9BILA|nr:unnamed protein product [Rotaria sordida]CAF1568822.1 unnamed protein product [Rotaria sordida]
MLLVRSQLIDERKRFFFISPFGIAFLIASIGTYSRFLLLPSTSLRKAEDVRCVFQPTYLTAAVWTVHFGYDNNARPTLDRLASVLADTNADLIGLLERDTAKTFFRNNDLTSYLGEKNDICLQILVDQQKIILRVHYLLASSEGELAPAVLATIQRARKLIDIIIVHMGNDRDDLDRKLQVFLGYITSERFSRDYRTITSVGKYIDPRDKDRWCQYILYKNLIQIKFILVLVMLELLMERLTDREIPMATFKILTSEKFDDHSILVTHPSVVTEQSVLFNSN